MTKRFLTILFVLLAITVLCACAEQAEPPDTGFRVSEGDMPTAVIAITKDSGKDLVLEKEISIGPDITALDALQSVAGVETKYGGGFVSAIEGIGSEYGGPDNKKKDWFFYINGIAGNIGAGDYILRAGDVEQWDFRDWSYQQFVSAVIGGYPQSLLNGFGDKTAPTFVVYDESFVTEAESLAEQLQDEGVSPVSVVRHDRLTDDARKQGNLIVIAGSGNKLIGELNGAHKKLGFYAYLEPGKIIVLNASGSLSGEYGPGSGLIQAAQNPWNPKGTGVAENVVWMVAGADDDGVKSAAMALLNNADKLRYAFAAIVKQGQVLKIP